MKNISYLIVAATIGVTAYFDTANAASTLNGCTFLQSCIDTPTGFEVPDGISTLVCTNNGGCIDLNATYQQGFINGYESTGTAAAAGFTAGFKDGYPVGLAKGNQAGYAAGEQAGYSEGEQATYWPAYNIAYPIGYADGQFDKELDCGYGISNNTAGAKPTLHKKTAAQVLSLVMPQLQAIMSTKPISPVGPGPIKPNPPKFPFVPIQNLCDLITGCTVTSTGYLISDGEGGTETCTNGICEDNNPNYSSGFSVGKAAGEGTNYEVGYSAGTLAGSQAGYDVGYGASYPTGFTNGLYAGQAAGAQQGSSDGYEAGYAAGYASIFCGYN